MTEPDPGRPHAGQVGFVIRRRPQWQLILVAVSIIALAALALQTLNREPSAPVGSSLPEDGAEASNDLVLDFTYECQGTTCTFRDASTGDIGARRWDFGDGQQISDTSTPTHSYATEGIYRVSLTVTDDSSADATITRGVSPGASSPRSLVSDVMPPVYAFGPHIGSSGGWELLDPIFTSAHVSPHPETVIRELDAARADQKSIIVLLARSAGNYKNPDGTFSLEMWKAEIDQYAGFDFTPWVEDGTLLAHYLISEPMSRSRWGGEVIPVEILDEMARYSKDYWPDLVTTVREQPTDLMIHAGGYETPVAGWDWSYLDAGWARYSARKGPIDDFIRDEVAAARSQELGLLFGMNVLAGGDGSSEAAGHEGGWLMSTEELLGYGAKLINEPYGCANFIWHLNHGGIPYLGEPEIDAVMKDLADIARSRDPISCTSDGAPGS